MKRAIAIFLLFIYSLTTIGISASVHLCGNKLASVQLFDKKEQKSCCKKNPAKKKCCHNSHFELKSSKSDQLASPVKNADKPINSSLFIDTRPQVAGSTVKANSPNWITPPFLNYKVPIHIQIRVLVI